jgi:hypothetical protein
MRALRAIGRAIGGIVVVYLGFCAVLVLVIGAASLVEHDDSPPDEPSAVSRYYDCLDAKRAHDRYDIDRYCD